MYSHGRKLVRRAEIPAVASFLLDSPVSLWKQSWRKKERQKQHGAIIKKKGVANRRWLPGRIREAYLFLFIPPFSFPLCLLFVLFLRLVLPRYFGGGGCVFQRKRQLDTLQEDLKMDQAGILRKFIHRVKAMSEGDDERGEDNFGSDFMVGQNYQHLASFHIVCFNQTPMSV